MNQIAFLSFILLCSSLYAQDKLPAKSDQQNMQYIIQTCFDKMDDEDMSAISENGYAIHRYRVFAVESEYLNANMELTYGEDSVCIRNKGFFFQLNIEPFLNIVDLSVEGNKAKVTIELHDNLAHRKLYKYTLQFEDENWEVE